MQYEDAFAALITAFPDAGVVSTCGHISRDLFNYHDRPGAFYMVGSMGLALPVAAGVAMCRPDMTVLALDGDGSFAMNVSAMLAAATVEGRLVHVVLDNGVHGSTGGQTALRPSDPLALARAAGYRSVLRLEAGSPLPSILDFPAFIYARVDPRQSAVGRRVTHHPHEIRDRFRDFATRAQRTETST